MSLTPSRIFKNTGMRSAVAKAAQIKSISSIISKSSPTFTSRKPIWMQTRQFSSITKMFIHVMQGRKTAFYDELTAKTNLSSGWPGVTIWMHRPAGANWFSVADDTLLLRRARFCFLQLAGRIHTLGYTTAGQALMTWTAANKCLWTHVLWLRIMSSTTTPCMIQLWSPRVNSLFKASHRR